MNNLLEILKKGKNKHIFIDNNEFERYLNKIQLSDKTLKLDWDKGAGEEWARFIHEKYGIVYMINARIGINFVRKNYLKQISNKIFLDCELFITEKYSEDEWFVDLEKLKEEVSEICWHASESAVNPNKFSLNDLYFATI